MILETNQWLQCFSFEELTALVSSLIENAQAEEINPDISFSQNASSKKVQTELSEEEIEFIINLKDATSNLMIVSGDQLRRVYKRSIVIQLKELYHYKCQICGHTFNDLYSSYYAEAHHIEFFAETHNNNAGNIIILCPNHHRAIHLLRPEFDRSSLSWSYPNGTTEVLKYNLHLS